MKRLILINGTMGVGKTATCNELIEILQPSVFLDGDWCWNSKPFIVTSETKQMVLDNIAHLLNNFLSCPAYDNVIFCWVMHQESIINSILSRLVGDDYEIYKFTLTASESALTQRITKDVEAGVRAPDVLERSLPRVRLYDAMDTVKIDVSTISPRQAAEQIMQLVQS